jgi:halocyanin-like protein
MKELIGKQLRHFRIDARLGTGGMGAVYRAQDLNLRRTVAVKVMHPHLSEQEQFQRRFMQEARAAAGLDHPSIVEIYDFGDEDDLLFMVMQFVAGGSLADHIEELRQKDRQAKLNEILFLLAQVAVALDYAHGRGLIHRDVKPDNVLVQRLDSPDRPGEPPLRAVVTDFGLAKLIEGGVKTATGTFMGTLPYMSPEQALGKDLDGRSDVYSLGVILYQLATGRLPFDISTPTDAVRKHMHETPPPPATLRPGLPAEVVSIIDRAIAKDPGERFQSAAEMARAVRAAITDPTEAAQLAQEEQPAVSLLTQLQAAEPVTPDETGEQMPPPQNVDRLIVARQDATPQTHNLEKPAVTIGRREDNDVVLPAAEVSGQHARLEQTERGWQVVDLDSTNGTYLDDDRLLPNVPETWEAGQDLRIGPYFLQWQAATVPEAPGGRSAYRATEIPPEASQAQSAGGTLSIIINPENVTVAPGTRTEVQVALINYGNTVEQFGLEMEGLPVEWITVPQEPVGLMPGERADLSVSLHPPQDSQARAGEHSFRLIARALADDGEEAVTSGTLVVDPFHRFTAEIAPAHVSHGDTVQVSIRNEGNDEAQYTVRGQDPAQAILFDEQHTVTVAPGEEATVPLTLTAKEQPRVGRAQTLPFAVEVGAGDGLAFGPAAVAVSTGTTVTWEWTGEGGQHNVAGSDGDFESETVGEEGHTFEHTFDATGEFTYFYQPHKMMGMKGVVVVE